ncbi:ArsR/SmtB family transcription factor [Microbacterium radiodurans]|uniref:ArsR/SmtB family transcription factor n=1 Tax=Microbacterium radiodurans TaxID=661398 RepID=UPI00168B74D5|nr:winged helix-turn-helix domain-containing protein [Microbacterium radiodurans]
MIQQPSQLKALAHPARFIAFEELFATQRALTATELAAVTGVSPSSMSYHLRMLHAEHLIQAADETSDGRERRWRAPATAYEILVSRLENPAQRQAMVDAYLAPVRSRISAALAEPEEVDEGGTPSDTPLATGRVRLGVDDLVAMQAEMAAIVEKYEARQWTSSDDSPTTAYYMWSVVRDRL